MSDHMPPTGSTGSTGSTDAFDALLADATPVAPSARFAAELRRQLDAHFDQLPLQQGATTMTDTITPAATTSAATTTAATAAADLTVTNTVTPYLCVDGAAAAIDFYVQAFGAVEHHRIVGDDGRVGHAEIVIGGSRLMLADEYPEIGVLSPTSRGGSSTNFTIDVSDVDAAFARAIALGATELRPVEDQFYGARQGTLRDPFGHQWSLSQPLPMSEEEYAANSREAGYEVVKAAATTSTTTTATTPPNTTTTTAAAAGEAADAADHQVKAHATGDLYYFTLPVTDLSKGQRFFSAVLGWHFADPDNGHVGNISAPPGGLNVSDAPGARLWFVVDDIHAAVERVRAAGGTADEPVFYPSGWSADCVDDQGTVFSLSVPTYTR